MENFIDQYREIGNPTAFSGIRQASYKFKDVAEKLSHIDSYTRHRFVAKPRRRNPIYVYRIRELIQVDLAEVAHLAHHNGGVRYLLMCIDTFSRKLWVRAMINKSSSELVRNMKDILREINSPVKVKRLFSDRGTEFMSNIFKNMLREYSISHTLSNSNVKCAHVERVIQTIKGIMHRYLTEFETHVYINKLQDIVKTYNSRIHSAHKMTPNEADLDDNRINVLNQLTQKFYDKAVQTKVKAHPKLQIGDVVRLMVDPGKFTRGHHETFTGEYFKINKVYNNLPHVQYGVTNYDGSEEIEGRFYPSELQVVHADDVFKVERVLDRKTIRRVPHVLVKWLHFPDRYNQWIPETSITEVYHAS